MKDLKRFIKECLMFIIRGLTGLIYLAIFHIFFFKWKDSWKYLQIIRFNFVYFFFHKIS